MATNGALLTKDEFLQDNDPALAAHIPKRSEYPQAAEKPQNVNFMSTVTKLIKNGELGSFISKGIYPSPLHEGLSELQRKAESAISFPILDKAAKEPKGSEMRLMYVTSFNVACWFEQRIRMSYKPVKPVQNETFEYVDPDGKFKLLVEEVLQNRDAKTFVSCWKAWGQGWSVEYEMIPKIKFSISVTGPCLEFTSNCIGEIKFSDGDTYTTTLAPGLVTSLASNPQVFSYKGTAYVTNVETKLRSDFDLSEPSMLSLGSKKHQVKGILTKNGKKSSDLLIGGKWDEQFVVGKKGEQETVVWQRDTNPRPANRYGLNELSIQLNYLTKDLAKVLPPTDTRLRPDVRAVEQGEYAKADEELQRVSALNDANISVGEDLTCKGKWFSPAAEGSYLKYRYKGGYWEAREAKKAGNAAAWAGCPDAFGLGSKYDDVAGLLEGLTI